MIHFFLGTKAQYIKTAPLLRYLDSNRTPYHLIDSGQHAHLMRTLRDHLQVRQPDTVLRVGPDLDTLPATLRWLTSQLSSALRSQMTVRKRIFRNLGGICLTHGDTPSTLLALILAKRAGLRVAHLEAGLRSQNWLHPFPEELIRFIVMRLADLLFAPHDVAYENLLSMNVRGTPHNLGVNTNWEALQFALNRSSSQEFAQEPYGVVTVHRVETLFRAKQLHYVVALARRISQEVPLLFILHPPTRQRMERHNLLSILQSMPNLHLMDLLPHHDFIALLSRAAFAISDGGSIQEECYYLNIPCLILRHRTERPEGLGKNAILAHFDDRIVHRFLSTYSDLHHHDTFSDASPSAYIYEKIKPFVDTA